MVLRVKIYECGIGQLCINGKCADMCIDNLAYAYENVLKKSAAGKDATVMSNDLIRYMSDNHLDLLEV